MLLPSLPTARERGWPLPSLLFHRGSNLRVKAILVSSSGRGPGLQQWEGEPWLQGPGAVGTTAVGAVAPAALPMLPTLPTTARKQKHSARYDHRLFVGDSHVEN